MKLEYFFHTLVIFLNCNRSSFFFLVVFFKTLLSLYQFRDSESALESPYLEAIEIVVAIESFFGMKLYFKASLYF